LYSEEGTGRGPSPPRPLLAVPNVTAHPSTASVPTSYYLMFRNRNIIIWDKIKINGPKKHKVLTAPSGE